MPLVRRKLLSLVQSMITYVSLEKGIFLSDLPDWDYAQRRSSCARGHRRRRVAPPSVRRPCLGSSKRGSTLFNTLTIPMAALSDTAFNSCRRRRCLHSHSCCCSSMTHHPLFLHPSSARWNLLRPSILPIEVFSPALIFKLSHTVTCWDSSTTH